MAAPPFLCFTVLYKGYPGTVGSPPLHPCARPPEATGSHESPQAHGAQRVWLCLIHPEVLLPQREPVRELQGNEYTLQGHTPRSTSACVLIWATAGPPRACQLPPLPVALSKTREPSPRVAVKPLASRDSPESLVGSKEASP